LKWTETFVLSAFSPLERTLAMTQGFESLAGVRVTGFVTTAETIFLKSSNQIILFLKTSNQRFDLTPEST
jgi:hypothetical protein